MIAPHYEVTSWRGLSAERRRRWTDWQAAQPSLRSPYFHLGWCDALDGARGDLRVLQVLDGDEVSGFLPFHRTPLGVQPAGGVFADWHGFIAPRDAVIDARAAVRAMGGGYRFTSAPASDPALARFAAATAPSHLIDLSDGFATYARPPDRAAPRAVRKWRSSSRKLQEDGRTLRLVFDDRDDAALKAAMRLKAEHLRRTRQPTLMDYPWVRRLMETLFADRADGFGGQLSTLWLDDRLAAAHFGLRCGAVLHYWQPAYTTEFAGYSPGILMMVELAREGAQAGLQEIDLGVGDYRHKHDLANAQAPAIAGVVHSPSPLGQATALACLAAGRWAQLPVGPFADLPARVSRRLAIQLARYAPPAG